MQFAANPREFDRAGLPKYGADLSDDECEVELYETMLQDHSNSENMSSRVSFAPSIAGGIPGVPGKFIPSLPDKVIPSTVMPGNVVVIPSKPQVGATPGKPLVKVNQAGVDRMAMIRNDVRETASARARGDLTGDLGQSGYNRPVGGYKGGSDLFRPLRTTVAYDSDLDMESSDEGSV
jgi:hypothetical protein